MWVPPNRGQDTISTTASAPTLSLPPYTTADMEKMKETNDAGWTRCIFFTRPAGCSQKENCKFWHDNVEPAEKAALEQLHADRMAKRPNNGPKMGVCWEYQETGGCKFGARCKFEHVAGAGAKTDDNQ